MSLAERFRDKANEYEVLRDNAPSVVMRAWYESLCRSYAFLAVDEDRFYSQPLLPMVDAGPIQPEVEFGPRDLQTLDDLEAELAIHIAGREQVAAPDAKYVTEDASV